MSEGYARNQQKNREIRFPLEYNPEKGFIVGKLRIIITT
jgi:hypothetical protein